MKKGFIGMATLFSLSPVVAFAHEFGESGWGNHMGFMGSGWGNPMGFMGGGLMMFIWIGLLILAVVAITRWVATPGKNRVTTINAQGILAERYARGEISQQEFVEMKKQLQ
ncbi:MAG: SHOCT domain-containing protein [bacterium]